MFSMMLKMSMGCTTAYTTRLQHNSEDVNIKWIFSSTIFEKYAVACCRFHILEKVTTFGISNNL